MSAFNFDSLKKALGLSKDDDESPQLTSLDMDGLVEYINQNQAKNIIVMCGAGISTAAGIPDFRSPGSGIYDNLEQYNLSSPMDVFSIDFFDEDPRPFFEVARLLYKPDAKPTLSHYFIRLLDEKKLLCREYTQNVDALEHSAGLEKSKIIEAHGTFLTGHCRKCRKEFDFEYQKTRIMGKELPKCDKEDCKGVVKPDVVFFGENLPKRFYNQIGPDFSACDLLIIMGTSLTVMPFCGLIHRVGPTVPRVYINREYTDGNNGSDNNKRDIFLQGSSDDIVLQLADKLGWKQELLDLKTKTDASLDSSTSSTPAASSSK